MNFALVEIGINFPKHRKRALAIGEKLGIYRDHPDSKGCTSPVAPIWINEMVKRQGLVGGGKRVPRHAPAFGRHQSSDGPGGSSNT